MVEYFIRHDNIMSHVTVWFDPVYLTEPLIRSQDFVLKEQAGGNWLWPCEYVDEISGRPPGDVPHFLPGASPFLGEFAYRYGIPLAAANGGAETTRPEYLEILRALPPPTMPAAAR
jgi:hypothetical protein